MAKLTLSVDDDIITRAKTYAAENNTSVSAIVERLLDAMTRLPSSEDDLPVLRRLRGSLAGADANEDDYRDYLVEKFGK